MRATTGALLALASASVIVVSSAQGVDSAGRERPVGELRDCASRGEGRSPQKPPVGGVRLGPLVLWPSVRGRASRTEDEDWGYMVKAPVVLPARAEVVLAIAPGAASLASFQHRGFVSAVRFEACREREPAFAYRGTVGKFTGFPFAIAITRRSACVPMDLWVDGRAAPLRRVVPVGRRSC